MVEVDFQAVWVRVARVGTHVRLAEPAGTVFVEPLHVVVLQERDGERVLPIWMGRPDAYALLRHVRGMTDGRPVAASVMAALLQATGGSVDHVAITRFDANVYYAVICVRCEERAAEVEARASDALNLAVRVDAPMLVAGDVMREVAFAASELPTRLDALQRARVDTPLGPGAWRPLSPQLVNELKNPVAG